MGNYFVWGLCFFLFMGLVILYKKFWVGSVFLFIYGGKIVCWVCGVDLVCLVWVGNFYSFVGLLIYIFIGWGILFILGLMCEDVKFMVGKIVSIFLMVIWLV